MPNPTNSARERLRYGWLSVGVAVVVFGGKLAAYLLTGSTAVLSDAMESVVNVVAATMLVFSLVVAARPADRDHPYGHGKIEFFSAGLEAGLIVVAGVLILVEAGRALLGGGGIHSVGFGLVVLGGFSAINAVLGLALVRAGRRFDSMALLVDGKHVLVDVWTSAGVIAGLVLVEITGLVWLDPLIAIAVAVHILFAAWKIGKAAVDGLMDAADEASLEMITRILEERRRDEWIDVHHLRCWRAGAVVHTDFHLVVPRYLDVECLHEIHEQIERTLAALGAASGDVVVHFDPCRSSECASCRMPECPVREADFTSWNPLSVERVRRSDELVEAAR